MQNILKFTGIYKESLNLNNGKTRDNEDWNAMDIVIEETDVQYPQTIVANIFGAGQYADKVEKFLDYNAAGDELEVELRFSVADGKNGMKFNKLQAWKIVNLTRKARSQEKMKSVPAANSTTADTEEPAAQIDDDLPF